MGSVPNLSISMTKTLKETDLTQVSIDIAESLLDTTLQNGVLKDIPILGSIVRIGKTAYKIQDVLFLKKILSFINEIKDIPPKKRDEIISKIDTSKKYRLKIGEKLLYILDKADDNEKALLIGKLFKAFLLLKIGYDTFLRGSTVIDRCIMEDLEWFIVNDWNKLTIEEAGEFINWGLFEIEPLGLKIKEKRPEDIHDYWDERNPGYSIEGGELSATITFVGKELRKYLR